MPLQVRSPAHSTRPSDPEALRACIAASMLAALARGLACGPPLAAGSGGGLLAAGAVSLLLRGTAGAALLGRRTYASGVAPTDPSLIRNFAIIGALDL